jgi:hypothetical protein
MPSIKIKIVWFGEDGNGNQGTGDKVPVARLRDTVRSLEQKNTRCSRP